MKKLFSTFLAVLLAVQILYIPVSAASSVVFTISETEAAPGSTIAVEVTVESTTTFNSLALYNLTYDPDVLSFAGFSDYEEIEAKCVFHGGFDDENEVVVLPLSQSEALDGYICKILFTVADTAANGTYTVSMSSLVKENATVISSAAVAGAVTVSDGHAHPLTYREAKDAYCSAEGYIAHWYCETCDAYFADAKGTEEYAAADVILDIDPAVHLNTELLEDVEPTEDMEGFTGNVYCVDCGELVEEGEIIPVLKPDIFFTFSDVTGVPGEIVSVELSVASGTPFNSVALYNLAYDVNALSFNGFFDFEAIEELCEFTGGFDHDNGVITLPLKETAALNTPICTLEFVINDYAADGTYEISMSSIVKEDAKVLLSSVDAGSVTVGSHTHSPEYTEEKAATCTESGHAAYWYCEECDTYFLDEYCNAEINESELIYDLDPNNHAGGTEIRGAVDPTPTEEGYTGDTYCLGCGEIITPGEYIPATGTDTVSGTFGTNGTWTLENGTLTLEGDCAVPDYGTSASSAPWGSYRADVTDIVIGNGITSIGDYAFYNMKNAAAVVFEADSSLTTIGIGAFGYTDLLEVTIPASVETIEKNAFYYCASLRTVDFEEGSVLTTIGNYAFRSCTLLSSITLPERIVSIGSALLYQTSGAAVAVAEGSVAHAYAAANNYSYTTYEGTYCGFCGVSATWVLAADGTLYLKGTGDMSDYTTSSASAPWGTMRAQIKNIVVGKGVTSIGSYAFYNVKNLESVTFEANAAITVIGEGAFGYTGGLSSITLPASLKTVGEKAFFYSSIANVAFATGSKLASIGRFAFRNCASLETVFLPAQMTAIGDKILYSANADATLLVAKNTLAQTYAAANGYKTIVREETLSGSCGTDATWTLTPDGTLTIDGTGSMKMFGTSYKSVPWGTNRAYIETVVIGNGITDITNFAFYNCTNLSTVEFEANSSLATIGTSPFSYTDIESIEIPASVGSIGKNAFAFNDSLTTVDFEENSVLTTMGNYAFQNCPALEYVYIPETVETMGAVIFYLPGETTSATISVSLGTPSYKYVTNGSDYTLDLRDTYLTGICGRSATWTFNYDTGNLTISGSGYMMDYAYGSASANAAPWACTMRDLREFVTSVTIGSNIESIGRYAFCNFSKLTSVTFNGSENLKTICEGAFGYSGLTTVTIPASVTSIEKNAFYYNRALTTVNFAADSALTTVGNYAFRDCTALTTCTFPAGATLGNAVFYNCPNMK